MYEPFNESGVEIDYTDDSITMSYLVSGSDDITISVTVKKDELPDFLNRHKIRGLEEVDMSMLFSEDYIYED